MIYDFYPKNEKVEKLVFNLHDEENVVYTKEINKSPLNHGLVLKKVQRVINFNQEVWLKTCIDMNIELKTCQK